MRGGGQQLYLVEAGLVVLAGLGAGTINAVVGSGSLITFPTLIWVGLPPVVANVSNTVGLVPGAASGGWGYRRELAGQRGRLLRLGTGTLTGSLVGAILLLVLPPDVFATVVPALILLACLLVVIQPWLVRRLADRPRREARIVGNLDLAPTFADAAGAATDGMDGASLLPLLAPGPGDAPSWRSGILLESMPGEGEASARMADRLRWSAGGGSGTPSTSRS